MKKDKQKVIDEVWTEDHIRSFLEVRAYQGNSEDFHLLLKAYQNMRPDDFKIFLSFFLEEKRDINAVDDKGNTLLQIVSQHRHGADFAEVLKSNGASQ